MKPFVLAFSLLFPCLTFAQGSGSDIGSSRLEWRVGAELFSSFGTRLRIDSETLGLGTELELETDLALEESIRIGRIDGIFRLNPKHELAMSYYDINRTGVRPTGRDISVGDEFFPEGTPTTTRTEQQILKLAYRYRFINRERSSLSGSFGLHTVRFSTAMSALDGSVVSENSADAPLPVLGMHGTYRFGERWRFVGDVEWFDISAGDLQGTFMDALLAVEHDTFEKIGIGFGMNRFRFNVEAGDENLRGELRLTFDAAVIYFRGAFGSVG
jgi:hypothetical protein